MSFHDLESGREAQRDLINGKQDATQVVPSGIFQINTAVNTLIQEAIVSLPWVALVVRPRPRVWEYIRVNVHALMLEQLQVKEELVYGSLNGNFVLELDFEPFNASFPRPTLSKSIGNEVKFLNRHLSAKLFHDKESLHTLLEFLQVHCYKGKSKLRLLTISNLQALSRFHTLIGTLSDCRFISLFYLLTLNTFDVIRLIDNFSKVGILLNCLITVFELILRSSIYVQLLFLASYYLRVFGLVPGYHFQCYPNLPPCGCPLDFFKSAEGIALFLPLTRTLSSLRSTEFRNRFQVILSAIPIVLCIYQCDSFVLVQSSRFVVAFYMLGDFEKICLSDTVDRFTSNTFDLLPRRTSSEEVLLCHLSMYLCRVVSSSCLPDVNVVYLSVLCNRTLYYYY